MDRLKIKITGESGAGLLSTGSIVNRALSMMGFHVVADREYPSLIKGGHSCFAINASSEPIHALCEDTEIMLCIDKQSMEAYIDDLKSGGLLVHGYEKPDGIKDMMAKAKRRKVRVVHQLSREIAESVGGNVLMVNVVLAGMLWKAMGFDLKYIRDSVAVQFADKPKWLPIDIKCVEEGYKKAEKILDLEAPKKKHKKIMVDGNQSIALGAIHCGVRAYFAYPMSPSSSILTHMAEWCHECDVLVKQVEDEISVAQMTLGAMHMGTRALCATSGGGYDLMTETVSLAGMIETPFVCVVVQRPGPATGLPTWTAQGDFNLAIHSSHGEFARVVIGVSDPESCFDLIQHAFNIAEKYQIVVIVLSDKSTAETRVTVDPFKQKKIKIERGLVTGDDLKKLKNEDRFAITKSGVSKRWLPGSSKAYYFANGDEHWVDGSLTEDAKPSEEMYAKRMRKLDTVKKALPKPEIFGAKSDADLAFVGWGSTKNVMLDAIEEAKKEGIKVSYLHYDYVFPLDEKAAQSFMKKNEKTYLIEGNYLGQFGEYVETQTGMKFAKKLLKYNGRPFFVEEVLEFIKKHK